MTDYEIVLICAMRYAIGRQTCIASIVVSYITSELSNLSDVCKRVIIKEIEYTHDYEDDYDKSDWMRLLKKLRGETE